jgi:hypothetical protein
MMATMILISFFTVEIFHIIQRSNIMSFSPSSSFKNDYFHFKVMIKYQEEQTQRMAFFFHKYKSIFLFQIDRKRDTHTKTNPVCSIKQKYS